MKKMLIGNLVQLLLSMLSPTALKQIVDSMLDMIEDAILDSETDLDDSIVTPFIELIRKTFDIPDNDEPKEVNAES